MALDATVGGASANSYLTVADATAILADRPRVDLWDDADPEDQAKYLVWATQLIEDQVCWKGTRTTTTQALQWPRIGVETRDHDAFIPDNIIPSFLKRATALEALYLLRSDPTALPANETARGIKSVTADTVAVEFAEPGKIIPPAAMLSEEVWAALAPYIDNAPALRGNTRFVDVVRV